MLTLPHYQIDHQIYESVNSLVYRGYRKKDNQQVILKMLKQDYPSLAELTCYQQEYEVTHDLNLAGVIKTYGIEKYQNTLVIILEDFGGESLKQLLANRPLTIKEFLPFSHKIADSLGYIHAAHIIHKDINPSNIVWEPVSNQLKIIDFGIASRLLRENPTLKNPDQLEGTLAYLSPEQTGRINRSMDYRTDLYSLGVTFYELLTGQLPFVATDAMEVVHCHIAKTPTPLCDVNPDIPPIISDIVLKLLAKNAENRYQSAFGLKADLEKIQENLTGLEDLSGLQFELAQNDFSGRFQIPQKLYGREKEVNTLLQSFERVSQGACEMMLVAGYSGVGKTALVHEVHKPMTEKRGYFAAGKFDQYQRNIPYSALTQAFNEFCNYLLTESAGQLNQWREKILNAVGNNGQILIDIIPQLELVIGKQTTVTQVGQTEAQNRFNLVFQNFFRIISQAEHPLVLFIDDLQWADSASLNLLKLLMTDMDGQYFLIIGAYRDNEVDATHRLTTMIEDLQKAAVTVNTLQVQNLSPTDTNTLIAEALGVELTDVSRLANLVYKKTQGNAFFTHEFLKSLYEEALLTFDIEEQKWQWAVSKIVAKGMTDNVVQLMASKIEQLPVDTQTVLKLASCIGNQFYLETLSIIYQHSQADTLAQLWKAMEENLVFPLDDNYKLLELVKEKRGKTCFRFQHDRIQQAAYSLIVDTEKSILHHQIGEFILLAYPEDLEERLFEIVDHLNLGIEQVATQKERNEIARLNLQAGQKAKSATAYGAASNYLNNGLKYLATDCWQGEYELTLTLYVETMEAAFLDTNLEQAETLAQIVLQQAKTLLDKLKIYEVLIQLYMTKNQVQTALDTALKVLGMLGVDLEKEPPKQLVIENCYALPKMTAPNKLAAMRLLNFAISPSYTVAPELFPQIAFTMVNLSVRYGNSSLSAYGYANYGLLLCGVLGDIDSGYRFGELAIHLLDKFEVKEFKAKVLTSSNVGINHWKKLARNTLEPLFKAIQNGLEMGDIEYVGIAAMHYGSYTFWVGNKLESAEQELSKYTELMHSIKQEYQLIYLNIWQQTVFNLQGLSSDPCRLIGDAFNEDEILPNVLETNYGMAIFGIYLSKSMLHYLFKDFTQSVANAALAENYEQANAGVMVVPIRKFYYSLALLATYSTASSEKQSEIIRQVESHQQQMKLWASHAPTNYQHKYDLVEAEKAHVFGQLEAIEWYEKAITGAKENQYLQEEALAYELAAEFYLARGMDKVAQTYLREAHYTYQQWGAVAKVKDLEEKHPQMLAMIAKVPKNTGSTVTMKATVMASAATQLTTSMMLDLESVTKAAQTLAGEIVLSKLLEKMMYTLIENAGAERGLLILDKEGEWLIEAEGIAEASVNIDEVTVLQSLPIENRLPLTIVNYVTRSYIPVVLANALQEGIYMGDSYIQQHQLKSVLCSPILHQGKLIGLLYLENNLIEGAFTPARLKIVDMLSSQAAISLENALLYRTLEQKVEQRTAELATANQEITLLNERLKEDNLRMGAELDVARQLQQMVLPKESELQQIKGLDIAGFMEPADEIGGDYYDVLEHNGHIKIGIGDVTGHGLESGVVMLMVQMGVQTLLTTDIRNSEKFLALLNHAVHKNIKRIETDKNLTLSLLDYQPSTGILRITGQHEEILVVRQNGKVERVDTIDLGFMVGVIPNIAHMLSHLDIQLFKGDGIVLYTDGITEARDPKMKLYGVERLCEVVSHHWQLTSHEIQQAVVADVKQYIDTQKVFDDITLLILKQE
ncbi:AAA family ATPase [Candidatus Parabeggiatoa sp. HSG14]|uniref:AAA family ATPase n=1 Tax=Candidatus Parabeggiatoa sp. HSG14 TaxID=3055593 RepID=UPI0025A74445|nr:AAA family ATPase [Thiotrichales bacterium HSG14]